MSDGFRKAFVCGHPVAHSRSPLIHGHWLKRYGIAGSYERLDLTPEAFPRFLRGLADAGFSGGNVTLPHKEAAAASVPRRDAAAEMIGAVNTLWLEDGLLVGGNTDAYGFAAGLDELAPEWRLARTATVLGAGGAARAVLHALIEAGFSDIRVVNRTAGRARELADRFGGTITPHAWTAIPELFRDTGLLVNTTQLGMSGQPSLEVGIDCLPKNAVVSDVIYVPLETELLNAARARGLKAAGGLPMLLHQAVPGFERWFGVRPEVTDELRRMIEADVERAA